MELSHHSPLFIFISHHLLCRSSTLPLFIVLYSPSTRRYLRHPLSPTKTSFLPATCDVKKVVGPTHNNYYIVHAPSTTPQTKMTATEQRETLRSLSCSLSDGRSAILRFVTTHTHPNISHHQPIYTMTTLQQKPTEL